MENLDLKAVFQYKASEKRIRENQIIWFGAKNQIFLVYIYVYHWREAM